jgi:SsrA-binding protein
VREGEVWLVGAHIAEYKQANRNNHEPRRDRKLLLHRREIRKLAEAAEVRGLTLVPLRAYLVRGRLKLEIAVARGKNIHDKRDSMKRKVHEQEARRAMNLDP